MTISSQVSKEKGSSTIESAKAVSRVHSKRNGSASSPIDTAWGNDIVKTSWKREAVLRLLIEHIEKTENGCWEYVGSATNGYGSFVIDGVCDGKKILAHRAAIVAIRGEPIPDGKFVLHHCDNRRCFNPDHLFIGSQKDNLTDCSEKGRTKIGIDNGMGKFTDEQIEIAKAMLQSGKPVNDVINETGISRTHLYRIKNGYNRDGKGFVSVRRSLTDDEAMKVAVMLCENKLNHLEIAKITGVSKYVVADMSKGKSYKEFMKRASSSVGC